MHLVIMHIKIHGIFLGILGFKKKHHKAGDLSLFSKKKLINTLAFNILKTNFSNELMHIFKYA